MVAIEDLNVRIDDRDGLCIIWSKFYDIHRIPQYERIQIPVSDVPRLIEKLQAAIGEHRAAAG